MLGAHQDGAVAEAWLRDASTGLTRAQAVTAGQLIARQRIEGQTTKSTWAEAWDDASSKRTTAWLR